MPSRLARLSTQTPLDTFHFPPPAAASHSLIPAISFRFHPASGSSFAVGNFGAQV